VRAYDKRRNGIFPSRAQRNVARFGEAKEYGWSEEKARHYAMPEREDFGAYVKRRGVARIWSFEWYRGLRAMSVPVRRSRGSASNSSAWDSSHRMERSLPSEIGRERDRRRLDRFGLLRGSERVAALGLARDRELDRDLIGERARQL
jgi:hypothetical protein